MINRQQAPGLPPSPSRTVGVDSVTLPRNMKQTCKGFNTETPCHHLKKSFKCSHCERWTQHWSGGETLKQRDESTGFLLYLKWQVMHFLMNKTDFVMEHIKKAAD